MDELSDFETNQKHAVYGESIDVEGKDELEKEPTKTAEQRAKLFKILRNVGALSQHDDTLINELIDFCKFKTYHRGEAVFKQGDSGNHFYVVDSGDFDVIQTKDEGSRKIHTYHGSGTFGEVSLYYMNTRVASVVAATEGASLWELERKTYRTHAARKAFRRVKALETIVIKIKEFKALTPEELVKVTDALRPKNYAQDELIYKQNDAVDGFYVVEEGTLGVSMSTPGQADTELGTLTVGDYFGQVEIFNRTRRCSTVRSLTPVTLAFVSVNVLEGLLGPLDEFARRAQGEHAIAYAGFGYR